jgi:putative ABC transport system permease protein
MGRARFWIRWSWRDLRHRWVLVLAIALVIAIGTGIYSGLGSMENWRKASNDASFALLEAHDLEISLTEGTFAPEGELERLVASIPDAGRVAAADERLIAPTQVSVQRPSELPLLVPGEVVGSRLVADGPAIDGVAIGRGRGLRAADADQPVAVLEEAFAEYHGLPAAGSLRLAGGERLRYVGAGRSPEYFLVTRPGGGDFGGAEASFAVVFTSLETAQRTTAGRPVVNDLVLRLDPEADPVAIRAQLESALASTELAGAVTARADETAYRVLYQDAEGDQQLFNIFAVLILAGAAFATFNLATRIVEAQRREIGIGMALGVPPRELAIRPLLLGAQIALAGAAFGIALGLLAGDIFRGVLDDLLPLPVTRTPFEVGVFMRGALLGLLLPILATAIPVWRGVRLAPIEAIRVGFSSAKSSGVARLGKRLRLPGSSIAQLPFRNILRAPRRTLMTVLGIAAVVTVVVAFLGFVDSFLATVDRSEAEVAQRVPDRVTVALEGFDRDRGGTVSAVKRAAGVAAAEPRLELPGALASARGSFDASINLLDFGSVIWRPTVVEGVAPAAGQRGIVIAEEAARDLGLGVGDEVRVSHPVRAANGSFTVAETAVVVTGLHPNPFRSFAYMDRSQAAAMGMSGLANQVSVDPIPGASQETIARELFGVPGIASVERATATTDFVRDRLDDFVGVLRLTVGFALALALLIAFNSTSISADERARENATMLAFGIPVRGAVGLAIGESVITGLLGTALGLGGGLLVIGWVVRQTLPETLPDLGLVVSISGGSMLAAALVGVIAVSLAPLLTARRIGRMDVPSTLRVVE